MEQTKTQPVWWSGVVFQTTSDALLVLDVAKFEFEGDISMQLQRANHDGETTLDDLSKDARITMQEAWKHDVTKDYRYIRQQRVADLRCVAERYADGKLLHIQMVMFLFNQDMFTITTTCEDPTMTHRMNELIEQIVSTMEADPPDMPIEEEGEPEDPMPPSVPVTSAEANEGHDE